MPNYDHPTWINDDPTDLNDVSVRVVNDSTGEYIDLPASVVNDLTASFNDRAEFNEYIAAVNVDLNRALDHNQYRAPRDHDVPARHDDGSQVLYNDSPGYFQFKYIDNPALYDYNFDTGEYNVDCVTLNNYGIVADHHNGRGDHYRDWYIFDHNPFTCRNGCRPRPRTRPRLRGNPGRRSIPRRRARSNPEG